MLSRLAASFQRSLKKRPVITNTVVYFSFYTAAEASQQTVLKYSAPDYPNYNLPAAVRIACTGSLLYAPTLYFWYRFLDRKFPGTCMRSVVSKVCADQFIMTPILLAAFFTVLGVLEGHKDVFSELKAKYWKAFIANQMFWIPGQTVNFYLIPPHMRVVYVATVSFLWINVLCFIKRGKTQTS